MSIAPRRACSMVAELFDLYRVTDQTVVSKTGVPAALRSIGNRSPSSKVTVSTLSCLASFGDRKRMDE
ncbi:hypothetical protein ARD30_09965 [Bosea thiooxidans]|uniref:Uncharacterized protein n=1 Tax=Bosea thiooxidans TaxID=53254 RepID=A0A0Q3I7Z2_9HYPH|nr:hypothetical protein ARD30_09965 [Bosea thiooxidans]